MDRQEIKAIVHETLLELGIASDEGKDIIEFQKDVGWLRKQRLATEQISEWVKTTAVISVVSGILYLLWEGIKLAFYK